MQIELENLLAIGGVLVAVVASFFSFKDYIRDRFDDVQQKFEIVQQKLYEQSIERIRLEVRINALESTFKEFQGGFFPKVTNEQVETNQKKEV